jgi:hypothetical protein
MAAARTIVRGLLVVAAVAVTIGTVSNVFVDDAEVRAEAARVACGAEGCAGGPTRVERTPIAERLELVTRARRTVDIVCTRRAVLFGPYECRRE